ncbi:hypothetical protein Hanom_Chr00s000005g01612031 [Helianthus anomalus]
MKMFQGKRPIADCKLLSRTCPVPQYSLPVRFMVFLTCKDPHQRCMSLNSK